MDPNGENILDPDPKPLILIAKRLMLTTWLDWPTMEMPRKLTVSMLRVTVMMLRLRVESITLEIELARDNWVGWKRKKMNIYS